MFRGDMDGLPVRESTGLDYASKATAATEGGGSTPVAHACGHDAHVTFLLGVAKVMSELKGEWSGTLVLVAQPAEELILGARAMVEDGLYDDGKVPEPDYLVSSHVFPVHAAGTAAVRGGRRMAGTDQIDVTIYGIGGHGSQPENAKDPVVMGAMAVLGYQTIVSRAVDPQEPSVITVGAFQAGDSNNTIPDSVTLKVNLRWYSPEGPRADDRGDQADHRRHRDGRGHAQGPHAEVRDEGLVRPGDPRRGDGRTGRAALRRVLGEDRVVAGLPPVMGSEDFHDLARPFPKTRIVWIEIGCGPADVVEDLKKGIRPASNHNPEFKVELPAIAAGTKANAMVLLDLLTKE